MALAILGWRLPPRRRHRRPDILLMETPPTPFLLTSTLLSSVAPSLFVNPKLESVNSLEMIGRSPDVVTVRHHNNVTWTRDPGLECPNILCPTWQFLWPD